MKDIEPELMWAIHNQDFGFYIGTWLTRYEAIRVFTEEVGRSWDKCKKNGDRCIRVVITPYKKPVQNLKGETWK